MILFLSIIAIRCTGTRDEQSYLPTPLPPNYFSRFHYYAQHVQKLFASPAWTASNEYVCHNDITWPSVLSYASAHILLPKLRILSLEIRHSFQRCIVPWDWTNILIPPTLTEINYRVLLYDNHDPSGILEVLLSKCTNLVSLTLWAQHHDWSWDFLARISVPQSLKHLRVMSGLIDGAFFSWLVQIPRLGDVHIEPSRWGASIAPILCSIAATTSSSLELSSLRLGRCKLELAAQLLRTSKTAHLVQFAMSEELDDEYIPEIRPFLELLVKHSPDLLELELLTSRHLSISEISCLQPLLLRSLNLSAASLETNNELMQTLADFWPGLQVLKLDDSIPLKDLLLVPILLPQLRHLRIDLDCREFPNVADMAHFSGISLEKIRAVWLSHKFSLSVHTGPSLPLGRLTLDKLDMFAK